MLLMAILNDRFAKVIDTKVLSRLLYISVGSAPDSKDFPGCFFQPGSVMIEIFNVISKFKRDRSGLCRSC